MFLKFFGVLKICLCSGIYHYNNLLRKVSQHRPRTIPFRPGYPDTTITPCTYLLGSPHVSHFKKSHYLSSLLLAHFTSVWTCSVVQVCSRFSDTVPHITSLSVHSTILVCFASTPICLGFLTGQNFASVRPKVLWGTLALL